MDNERKEIDISVFFKVLKDKLIWIIIVTILVGGLSALYAEFFVEKQYVSSAKLYVDNKRIESDVLDSGDITTARQLAVTCEILFKSDSIIQLLKDNLNLEYSVSQLQDMISVKSISNTQVLQITTEINDPYLAQKITEGLTEICSTEFERVIESGTIKIIDRASLNLNWVFPSMIKFIVMGCLIGFIAISLILYFVSFFDIRVKPDDDLSYMYSIPVFAEVVSFENNDRINNKRYER